MSTTFRHAHAAATDDRAQRGARTAGLVGLVARGGLYLALAVLALELVFGKRGQQADTRGALHDLAHSGLGVVVLVVLTIGFAAFALWHLYLAVTDTGEKASRRVADGARAVVYGLMCALALSFLFTSKASGNSDQTDQTWTAKMLNWSGGRVLVGVIGIVILGAGLFLLWRAFTDDDKQDEPAVLDAAPRDTPTLRTLARVGNVARGAVVGLIGIFVLVAAIQHDPNETVGLDGALKRLLDHGWGEVVVFLVALGFAAFGVYSIARAAVNRSHATG